MDKTSRICQAERATARTGTEFIIEAMVNVTARKIRDHGRERSAISLGRVYHGFLVSYPVVGRGMVIFRDPNGHRMVTTPVKRVLTDPDTETVYVETENSVYRLTFHAVVPLVAVA